MLALYRTLRDCQLWRKPESFHPLPRRRQGFHGLKPHVLSLNHAGSGISTFKERIERVVATLLPGSDVAPSSRPGSRRESGCSPIQIICSNFRLHNVGGGGFWFEAMVAGRQRGPMPPHRHLKDAGTSALAMRVARLAVQRFQQQIALFGGDASLSHQTQNGLPILLRVERQCIGYGRWSRCLVGWWCICYWWV